MKIVKDKIKLDELKEVSTKMSGLVKAVVDIQKGIMAVDAPLHADEEKLLLDEGCQQQDVWGINLYPEFYGQENFIEFDSMINLRPWQNNRTRSIEDEEIRNKIIKIVNDLIER